MTDVGNVTVRLEGDASGAQQALDSVSSGLTQIGTIAAGVALGQTLMQGLDTVQATISNIVSSMMSLAAQVQLFDVSMSVLFTNMNAMQTSTAQGVTQTSAAVANAADAIVSAQQRASDAAVDHANALAKIGEEAQQAQADATTAITDLTQTYQDGVAQIDTSHAKAMASFADEEAKATANYQDQLQARTQAFQASMQSLQDSHAKAMANLQDQLDKATAQYETKLDALNAKLATAMDKAPDSFEAQKKASASTAAQLQKDLDAEVAKGSGADQALIAALQRRISEEQGIQSESYSQYVGNLQAQQDAQRKALADTYDAQVAAIKQKMALEDQSYAEHVAKLKAQYAQEVAKLQETLGQEMTAIHQRMADEMTAYQENLTKKAEVYQKDVANAKKAEAQKLQALQERLAQEDLMYARKVRDDAQALAKAERGAATAGAKGTTKTGPPINEIPGEQAALEAYAHHKLTPDEIGPTLTAYLLDKQLNTPFQFPQMLQASNVLQGYGLSTPKWLQTLMDTSAGSPGHLSPQEVAGYIGMIATGQSALAVRVLARQGGVNLRAQLPNDFDARTGQLTVSAEKALADVQRVLDLRFHGAALAASRTTPGAVSNVADVGNIIGLGAAGPVNQNIADTLNPFIDWSTKHLPEIKALGAAIGDTLNQAFEALKPSIDKITAAFETWVGNGKAVADVQKLGDTLATIAKVLATVAAAIWNNREALMTLLEAVAIVGIAFAAVGLVVGVISSPIIGLIFLVAALLEAWKKNLFGMRDVTTAIWDSISAKISDAWTIIHNLLTKSPKELSDFLGNVFAQIRDTIESAFLAAAEGVGKALNGMIAFIETFLNTALSSFEKFISGLLGLVNPLLQKAGLKPVELQPLKPIDLGRINLGAIEDALAMLHVEMGLRSSVIEAQAYTPGSNAVTSVGSSAMNTQNVTINNNVQGSVVTEKQLTDTIRRNLVVTGRQNGSIFGGLS